MAGGRSQTVTDTQIASPMPGDIRSTKHWKLSKMRTPERPPAIFQAKPCALTGRKKRNAVRHIRSNQTASEWNVHSFGIQSKPSRPVGTAAEVVERVARFVARSTTDWCQKDAERSRTGVHKCLSPPEKASRESRSNGRRSYRAGRCARRANPIGCPRL